MMNTELPGIKYLRGLNRRQILMKLLVSPETEEFCGYLTEMAETVQEGVQACLEYNPVNMI